MAKEAAPAFQFYPSDFLNDENVCLMSDTEVGVYWKLVCKCWMEQSLPANINDLARLAKWPVARFRKVWDGPMSRCFYEADGGRLRHKRLDEERAKQEDYRRRQSDKGKASVASRLQPKANHGSTTVAPRLEPTVNSSSSSSSSSSVFKKNGADALSRRPMYTGQRLVIHEWQVTECLQALAEKGEAFDLHSWFFDLDAQLIARNEWAPKRDGGAWLQAQLVAEAQRRGIPLRIASVPAMGKSTTRLGSALATIAAEEGHDPH